MAGMWKLAAIATAAASIAGSAWAQTPPAPAAGDDASLVDRGAYIARAADCMPCHTGDPKKPYAGNLGFNTPFGTMFSVNITSDPTYGIGKWTFQDFKNAVHDGVRADGAYLYPAMPFDAYTGMSDDDLKALWAYVRRIPAIAEPRQENQLGFPFNIRLGLLAWRELFFDAAYWKPTTGKSAEWNRGSYLVEVLGHCSDCHTPRNLMGAVKAKQHFLGADIDGYWAPSIDSAKLKSDGWTKDTLIQFFTNGSVPGKTEVFGPMAEVVRESLAYLTTADRAALVTYLLDSPPPKDVPAPQAASPLPADVFQQAAKLYIDNCAPCHQAGGVGSSVIPALVGNPAVNAAEPYNVIMAVLGGLPAGGTYGPMPSFAGRLSDQQVANLVNYVRTAWHNGGSANATPAMVSAWRATANVPNYGTQQASAFNCPQVGGAPGAPGPDAQAISSLTKMMQGGERETRVLITAYQNADTDASAGTVVDALTAAYCPVVAQTQLPDWQKAGELQRFTLQVAATISEGLSPTPMPAVSTIWATPTGTSLVARQPTSIAAQLTCPDPTAANKLVPKPLVDAAVGLLGKPTIPVTGDAATKFASTLVQQNPKARRADVANALIVAYCPQVVAKPNSSVAEQYSLLTSFGQQVIQTLQLGAPMFNAASK